MLAFVNTKMTKAELIARLEAHRAADQLRKGRYWAGRTGCAVGCAIHSSNHALFEPMFGVPQMLAYLQDHVFEGMSEPEHLDWPIRFVAAIREGADLSLVGWKFLSWLVNDANRLHVTDMTRIDWEKVAATVEPEVAAMAAVLAEARLTVSAARAENWSMGLEAAQAAAIAASMAVRGLAELAGEAARKAARWAARAAMATWDGDAYVRQADKLIALLEAA